MKELSPPCPPKPCAKADVGEVASPTGRREAPPDGKLCEAGEGSGCADSDPALFSLDARELDHLRPLFDGLREDRSQFRRRAPKHRAAELDDPALDLAVGEARIKLL